MPGLIFMNNFSIVVPVYNEEDNVKPLYDEIIEALNNIKDYEIIFVNDCSVDETQKILQDIKDQKIKIITHNRRKGQSLSILTGIKKSKFNVIVTIDGDGQNNPHDINKLLEKFFSSEKFSLVAGIRVKRFDSKIKVVSSRIANGFRSFVLNDGCKDTGCGLKVFSKQVFLEFPFFDGIHRFLPALFKGLGYKTAFINVSHRPRLSGFSKYGIFARMFKGLRDTIRVKSIIKNTIRK